jgi:hypothetical protein
MSKKSTTSKESSPKKPRAVKPKATPRAKSAARRGVKRDVSLAATDLEVVSSQLRAVAALLRDPRMYSSRADWNELVAYTGLSIRELGAFLTSLAELGLASEVVVPAGRTPIGGRWPKHRRWQAAPPLSEWMKAQLVLYRQRDAADPKVIDDVSAALKGLPLPSIQARHEAERAQQEQERAEVRAAAERKRQEERDRLLSAIESAEAGEDLSDDLRLIIAEIERASNSHSNNSRVDEARSVLRRLRDKLDVGYPSLLRILESRVGGLAHALVVCELDPTPRPEVRDVVFSAMIEHATAHDVSWEECVWDYCHAAAQTSHPVESSLGILPMLTRYEEEQELTIESMLGHNRALSGIWGYAHTSAVLRERGLEAALQWVEQQSLDRIYEDPIGVLHELARAASHDDTAWERTREIAGRVRVDLPPRG